MLRNMAWTISNLEPVPSNENEPDTNDTCTTEESGALEIKKEPSDEDYEETENKGVTSEEYVQP